MQWKYDIVVIGAGAAGIAAAKSAFAFGCRSILLIDARKQMGGVLIQCAHHGFGSGLTGPEYIEKLTVDFPEEAEVWLDTTVLSIKKEKELVVSGAAVGVRTVSFQQLILAAGCLEIPIGNLAAAGTRPKGIYTAGQMQEMLHLYQEVPEEPVVILGSGDLGLILAADLSQKGIKVGAIVEQNPGCGGMAVNQKCLAEYQIPLICSSTITRIYGTDWITEVEITNLQTGKKDRMPCRSLLTAVGLRPDWSLLEGLEHPYPDWIHICGNCRKVHPVIEAVIKEGKKAGSEAWACIQKESGG